jgi:hypothetical protein
MICKKHHISMSEVNGKPICPMCEKGIPGDVIFFEKNIPFGTIIEKRQKNSDSDTKRKRENGESKKISG